MIDKTKDQATRSALVVVDVQNCFTQPMGSFDAALANGSVADFYQRVDDVVIPSLKRLLAHFRVQQWPIYFTEMGSLRADGADLPLALRRINESSIASTGKPAIPPLDNDTARTDERIAPAPGEIVFRKTTTGTLGSSPLAQNLLSLGYSSVCVAGIVTDCCVSQTARELADMDFDVTIIEDACASYVTAHHRAVLEIFANYYGTVNSADGVIAMLD